MKMVRYITIMLTALWIFGFSQNPIVIDQSSSPGSWYCWGGWAFPYQWYRYAQCQTTLDYTNQLHHPTYLNAIICCSQSDETSNFGVYIRENQPMLIIPADSGHYIDGWWSNWKSRSGGYYVGATQAGNQPILVSWNIESWISQHPDQNYWIVFDQMNDDWDAIVSMVWLGPQGSVNAVSELTPINPARDAFSNNTPNPFSKSTAICYYIPTSDNISIDVYDKMGGHVRMLCRDERINAGQHRMVWDGCDNKGNKVSSGAYFYKISAEKSRMTIQGKMMLLN